MRLVLVPVVLLLVGLSCATAGRPPLLPVLSGTVTSASSGAVPGALVTAADLQRGITVSVFTDARGAYRFPELPRGSYRLEARHSGFRAAVLEDVAVEGSAGARDLVLAPGAEGAERWPSAAILTLLPAGTAKQKFVLDCTGCHTVDARVAFPNGRARSVAEWEEVVQRMLRYAGATTSFPVISAERDPSSTARWLAEHLAALPASTPQSAPAGELPRATLTEYSHPVPQDLPHDVMVDSEGQVVITGMFTHRMFRLDPATGAFGEIPIPVAQANPRALDIDRNGNWWVLLGMPQKIARFDPASQQWESHDIGMYPHSIQEDGKGRVWFNGHFTKDPVRIGYLEAATGRVRTFDVPTPPELRAGAGPIPYDLRIAPDGEVWVTELHGNRVIRFSPDSEEFRTYSMPTPHSGPRRVDFDAQGILWIPEYAAGKLARFDPRTEEFSEYPLPIADALPYVVRVDQRSGWVWIGTGAADAILGFDPATERFTVYRLPSRGALIRHLDIDRRTGDLWAAYGAAPGIPPRIVRVQRG